MAILIFEEVPKNSAGTFRSLLLIESECTLHLSSKPKNKESG